MPAPIDPKSPASPRISDAEWTVMKVVWALKCVTYKTVVEQLKSQADWSPKTIHTLLTRLVEKGALARKDSGREYQFEPLVEEQDCRWNATRSFLARVFDGEIAPFVACFLERQKLSKADLEELRNLLRSK